MLDALVDQAITLAMQPTVIFRTHAHIEPLTSNYSASCCDAPASTQSDIRKKPSPVGFLQRVRACQHRASHPILTTSAAISTSSVTTATVVAAASGRATPRQ
jgi:hypothetical protein